MKMVSPLITDHFNPLLVSHPPELRQGLEFPRKSKALCALVNVFLQICVSSFRPPIDALYIVIAERKNWETPFSYHILFNTRPY